MTFRDQAKTELTALIERLTASADKSARAAVAEADAKARVTIEALTSERAKSERALQEERRAALALEKTRAGLEQAAVELEKSRAALVKERDALKTSLDAARTESAAARRDHQTNLETARGETDAVRRDLQAKLDETRRDTDAARRDLQAKLDETRRDTDAARRDLQTKLDEARRVAADVTTRAKEWRIDQVRGLREQAIAFVSRSLDRLIAVSEGLADVTTADEALITLADALATEFPRVALFRVSNGQLDGVQHNVGFTFPADPSHLVVPDPIDSVLDRAINSGQIEMVSAELLEATAGTAFGGAPACGLALPIDVNGEPYAIFYADDSGLPHQELGHVELRRKFADLLRQQAVPLLMRLPTELKAVAQFREYAARLVAELENMYAADVAARKKGDEVRRRLKDNVECARGIYTQRVEAEAPAAAGLIEHELALIVAAKGETPYGRDLKAVLGGGEERTRRTRAPAAVEA